jgi:undecaprenyl-diphosphatase
VDGSVTLPSRRVLLVVAAVAGLVFVLFGVLAVLPWSALRHADALGPSAGYGLARHAAGVRVPGIVVTDVGSSLVVDVVTVVAVVWLLLLRRLRFAMVVLVARAGELASGLVAKLVVGRERPDLLPRLTSASGDSFPSGHSAGSAAVYGAIALILVALGAARWVLSAAVVLVLAIAASRVLLGVHYPTDVLGGMALGVAWMAIAFAVLSPGNVVRCQVNN